MSPLTETEKEALHSIAKKCFKTSRSHGFWTGKPNIPEKLCLIHSEISEALEAYRHNDPEDTHCPGHKNFTVELADAVIRIFELVTFLEINLVEAMNAKMEFNQNRPYKHGKVC